MLLASCDTKCGSYMSECEIEPEREKIGDDCGGGACNCLNNYEFT